MAQKFNRVETLVVDVDHGPTHVDPNGVGFDVHLGIERERVLLESDDSACAGIAKNPARGLRPESHVGVDVLVRVGVLVNVGV